MKRAERRRASAIRKHRAKHYHGGISHDLYEDQVAVQIGRLARTPRICSCYLCKKLSKGEKTRQQLRANITAE